MVWRVSKSTCKRDCFTDGSPGNVRHRHAVRVVGLGVEGRAADGHAVVLHQDDVQAHGRRDELRHETILNVPGHLNAKIAYKLINVLVIEKKLYQQNIMKKIWCDDFVI